jgi:NAD(P)-dependent dehydrogenase (short-subunit alcohol dehydrogenase family)
MSDLAPAPGTKVCVVGGAGGIGRAVVAALESAGCAVAVLDLPASLKKYPAAMGIEIDAADEASVTAAFARLGGHWNGLGSLINLCGYKVALKPIGALSLSEWDDGIAGNLRSAFLVSRAAIPLIKTSGGGTVVHVSSGIGTYGMSGYGPYAAAKGAINAMAKTMAKDYAPDIRVNIVAPSLVDTAFLTGGTGRSNEDEADPIDRAAYTRNIPLQRVAEPADIVGPILFLAGPASRYMTGQILYVNGGAFMP